MKEIKLEMGADVPFHNHVDYCVGTGRMGLALHKEYLDQLALVQKTIGFSYIRGHGLFCDDMAIYHEYEEDGVRKAEYNFTYLDRVFDSYLDLGIRPFLELGFMERKRDAAERIRRLVPSRPGDAAPSDGEVRGGRSPFLAGRGVE